MLGDSGVGKTSLMSRWTEDTFNANLTGTLGVDFKMKQVRGFEGEEMFDVMKILTRFELRSPAARFASLAGHRGRLLCSSPGLGHCRARALPQNNHQLLQKRQRNNPRLRHLREGDVREHKLLDAEYSGA